MKVFRKIALFASITIFLLLFTSPVFAQGLVQCGNPGQPACNLCSLLQLVATLINFAITTGTAFVGLFITWGAFVTMTAGGSEERVKEGRKILTDAITGFVIMLTAWLILGTIVQVLTGAPNKLPWTQIQCTTTTPSQSAAASAPNALTDTTNSLGAPNGAPLSLDEQSVRAQLTQAGITINHDACPPGVSTGCTSLAGIQPATLADVLQLEKECSGCSLNITGGTEQGHAVGEISHGTGYKLDFSLNQGLNQYIQNNATYIGLRSDGATQYKASNGTIYAKEGDHWDVTFK